jgi:outer membrane lipoprotein-sorting protein
MKLKKTSPTLVSILTVFLLPIAITAGQGTFVRVTDQEHLMEKINENALEIESIQSSFIQKKQLEYLDETILSKGKFWFRKENNLRWAYEEPFEYAIIIHGGKFQIKDGEQISTYDIESNAAFREINDLIIGMVQGNLMERDKFDLNAFENEQQYLLKLVPREIQMRDVIDQMEVYFDKADLMVSEIVMRESEKDFTVITFIDRSINEIIPDAVFTTAY